jgi:hypothetical protein
MQCLFNLCIPRESERVKRRVRAQGLSRQTQKSSCGAPGKVTPHCAMLSRRSASIGSELAPKRLPRRSISQIWCRNRSRCRVRERGDGEDGCEDEALVVHCGGAEMSRWLGKAGIWKSVHGSDRTRRLVEGGEGQVIIVGCTVVMFTVRGPPR